MLYSLLSCKRKNKYILTSHHFEVIKEKGSLMCVPSYVGSPFVMKSLFYYQDSLVSTVVLTIQVMTHVAGAMCL